IKKILNVSNAQLYSFSNQAYASVIAEAANSVSANMVIMGNTFTGKGLAPRVAVKLDAGLADAVIELPKIEGTNLNIKRIAFSGKAFAQVSLHSTRKVLTLSPNAYKVVPDEQTIHIEPFSAQNK